jgi:hypothetical protein
MDAVQKANSGHPGTPMALAPVAYTLWQRHLRFDPADPTWPDRDRFVLSLGHASMLLYSLLHLAGVKDGDAKDALSVSLDDIKRFRQLDGQVAGRPLQPPRFRLVRSPCLRHGGRRLRHGGYLPRGGFAGRPPEARQPVLDLRQQPHHDRRGH